MCRKALFEKNFLTYASWISMQIKASSFLHILNVYSHTKLSTPVLVCLLQLSNFGLTHVTKHFSLTIDCVQCPWFGVLIFENAGIFVILKTRKYFLSLSYQTFYYTLQILWKYSTSLASCLLTARLLMPPNCPPPLTWPTIPLITLPPSQPTLPHPTNSIIYVSG